MQNSGPINAKLQALKILVKTNEVALNILVYMFIFSSLGFLFSPPPALVSDTKNYLARGKHAQKQHQNLALRLQIPVTIPENLVSDDRITSSDNFVYVRCKPFQVRCT